MRTQYDDYDDFVNGLLKNPREIVRQATETNLDLMHACLGIASEAGEIVDEVKKSAIYGTTLDTTALIKELGDMEFYLSHIRQILGLSRLQVITANREKLAKRFPKGKWNPHDALYKADSK